MNNAHDNDNFSALKSSVESIADKYFQCLKSLAKCRVGKPNATLYIKKVKRAYAILDKLDQRIINNEFFFQDYPDWWKNTYSKTTFYRIKRLSMKRFLEAFERAT